MSRTMKEVSEELQTNHEKDLNKLARLADFREIAPYIKDIKATLRDIEFKVEKLGAYYDEMEDSEAKNTASLLRTISNQLSQLEARI